MSSHLNNGVCPRCMEILGRYPKFHVGLAAWFILLQKAHPDAHISCAGRGRVDQEAAFNAKTSRAHYGQSAHNFNAAIDIFQLENGQAQWLKPWFNAAVASTLTAEFEWYGAPGSKFFELPHVQVAHWRELIAIGQLRLVE